MADRIKGITVEISGDTTGLSKALAGVNQEIKNTQSQLKDVKEHIQTEQKLKVKIWCITLNVEIHVETVVKLTHTS